MKFRYTARDGKGQLVRGVVEVERAAEVVVALREQKLTPVSVEPARGGFDLAVIKAKLSRVSANDVTTFTRQLATMITAGLPLTDALNLLKLQANETFRPVVGGMLADVQGGVALSAAMAKHPAVFSRVYVALVRAGETAGVVETILNRLADSLEKSREFTMKVKGAMIYPTIILIGMIGVMALMMVVVIPKLTSLYSEFGADLPAATKLLISISNFSVRWWWAVLALGAGGVVGLRAYINGPVGKRQWDRLVYKLPVMGPLLQQAMLAEMTRTLALLVGAGVSIVEALNIVAGAMGNVEVEFEIVKISKQVEKGFPMSVAFGSSPLFPPLVGQMVAVGEETGKMDDVLIKLSKYFETESEEKVKGLTTAIEPIIIILLGVGVGFLIFTIIMPIYNLTSQF